MKELLAANDSVQLYAVTLQPLYYSITGGLFVSCSLLSMHSNTIAGSEVLEVFFKQVILQTNLKKQVTCFESNFHAGSVDELMVKQKEDVLWFGYNRKEHYYNQDSSD